MKVAALMLAMALTLCMTTGHAEGKANPIMSNESLLNEEQLTMLLTTVPARTVSTMVLAIQSEQKKTNEKLDQLIALLSSSYEGPWFPN